MSERGCAPAIVGALRAIGHAAFVDICGFLPDVVNCRQEAYVWVRVKGSRNFGEALARVCRERGLTQSQHAEHLDVTRTTVIDMEKGRLALRVGRKPSGAGRWSVDGGSAP